MEVAKWLTTRVIIMKENGQMENLKEWVHTFGKLAKSTMDSILKD